MAEDVDTLRRERDELREALREIELYSRGLLESIDNGRAEKRFEHDRMRGVFEEINQRAQWPRPARFR